MSLKSPRYMTGCHGAVQGSVPAVSNHAEVIIALRLGFHKPLRSARSSQTLSCSTGVRTPCSCQNSGRLDLIDSSSRRGRDRGCLQKLCLSANSQRRADQTPSHRRTPHRSARKGGEWGRETEQVVSWLFLSSGQSW